MKQFFLHVNNHKNRKSYRRMTSRERKKAQPSYTVVGIIEGPTLQMGLAKCSKEDNFCKATGRQLAIENARMSITSVIPSHIMTSGELGKYFTTKARRIIKND